MDTASKNEHLKVVKCESIIKFKSFSKEYSWLSNFYPDVKYKDSYNYKGFVVNDKHYKSVEIYFQYMKFQSIGDIEYSEIVKQAETSLLCKKMAGKTVYIEYLDKKINHEFHNLKKKRIKTKKSIKEEVEEKINKHFSLKVQKDIMLKALRLKFKNKILKNMLLETGEKRIEEIGRFKCEVWTNSGQNLLGELLMKVREELKNK